MTEINNEKRYMQCSKMTGIDCDSGEPMKMVASTSGPYEAHWIAYTAGMNACKSVEVTPDDPEYIDPASPMWIDHQWPIRKRDVKSTNLVWESLLKSFMAAEKASHPILVYDRSVKPVGEERQKCRECKCDRKRGE